MLEALLKPKSNVKWNNNDDNEAVATRTGDENDRPARPRSAEASTLIEGGVIEWLLGRGEQRLETKNRYHWHRFKGNNWEIVSDGHVRRLRRF